MSKKWVQKLRSKAGETIAETLIATLVAALALTMLAGAIASAANIVTGSRTSMEIYRGTTIPSVQSTWNGKMLDLSSSFSLVEEGSGNGLT